MTEDPTSLSATWTTLTSSSGSYSFAYPAEWEDVSGDIGATADERARRIYAKAHPGFHAVTTRTLDELLR